MDNMDNYELHLSQLIKDLKLETVYMPDSKINATVTSVDINRPALQIAGYFNHFDNTRLQIFGMVENDYLYDIDVETRISNLDKFFSFRFPCLIITRDLFVPNEFLEMAQKYEVPILRTPKHTSAFEARIIYYLNTKLGPQITRHGVLVEVYGEGILILGESGVGKSETTIELIKRGHQLIADDAVIIKKVNSTDLIGTAPEVIRDFIELRGIGIVNVRRLFGVGAVKERAYIDMVVNIENWDTNKSYDRLGMDTEYMEILGVKMPSLTIPVKPGRNLAVILEVAAMNNRQRRMGYNAAEELNKKIMADMEARLGAQEEEK